MTRSSPALFKKKKLDAVAAIEEKNAQMSAEDTLNQKQKENKC
jgi:hypothetical protein